MKIDKIERYEWNEVTGKSGKLMRVPLSRLQIDHSYQRERLNAHKVLGIARDFDLNKFGVPLVGRRNDETLWVVDGQHRIEAAKKRQEFSTVQCMVFDSDGAAHEARVFIAVNTYKTNVGAADKYKSAVAYGSLPHIACDAMLSVLGLRVDSTGLKTPDCVHFIESIFKTFTVNKEMCRKAIEIQREMIGENTQLDNRVHKGIFYILRNAAKGNIADHSLRVYQAGGLKALLNSIKSVQIDKGNVGASDRTCAVGILGVVNSGLRTNKVTLKDF